MDARIVERARHAGQILLADRDDALVDLHEVDVLDVLVAAQLADTAAVAAADDEHLFDLLAEHGHRHMHHHFMVDELVALGQHHVAVEREKAAELLAFKYVDALKVALFGVKLAVHLNLQADRRRVHFGKGKLHVENAPFIPG